MILVVLFDDDKKDGFDQSYSEIYNDDASV